LPAKVRFVFDVAAVTKDLSKDLKMVFWQMDTDNDGVITYDEFVAYNKTCKYDKIEGSENTLRTKFDRVDRDGNGTLDFEELLKFKVIEARLKELGKFNALHNLARIEKNAPPPQIKNDNVKVNV